jgi:hypothetical protein
MANPFRCAHRALLGFLALVALPGVPIASSAASADPVWGKWITTLKGQGYSVSQGLPALHDCTPYIAVFGNCLNSNPSGGIFEVQPPVDNSYVDPCYNPAHDCSGATPNTFTLTGSLPGGGQAKVNQFYRLGTTDALVVIVNLPPNAAYLGYQTYVYSRPTSAYTTEGCSVPTVYADPCRTPIAGSVGNAINQATLLQQAGMSLSTGGSVAFITTSNQALYDSLSSAFQKAGGSSSRLFVEPLAQKIVAGTYTTSIIPGTDVTGDELSTVIRYTLPQNQADADTWQSALSSNIQIYRVRNAAVANTPFDSTSIAAKHNTSNELSYQAAANELAADLQQWLQSQTSGDVDIMTMSSTVAISKSSGLPVTTSKVDILGPYCILKGTNCVRDTQDTDSYRVTVLPTSLNRPAAIIGIDSTQTGNATYISVGVTDNTVLEGVAAESQTNLQATGFSTGSLAGSAADLVHDLVAAGSIPAPSATLTAALPKLFVAFATRGCPAGATDYICTKPYTMNVDSTALPVDHQVQLTRRSYVHPGDSDGPNPDYILPTQVVY